MGLTTNSKFPAFQGPTQAIVPTPTFSGMSSANAADSINPYTLAGPGDGGAGQTHNEIFGITTPGTAPFSQVQALINFNSGSIEDLSQNAFTLTNDGVTTGANTPFESGLGGVFTTDKITYPVAAQTYVGAVGTDFTSEVWVYPTAPTASSRIMGHNSGQGWIAWGIRQVSSNWNFTGSSVNGQANFGSHDMGAIVENTWQHLALTREGSTWRGFVNGIKTLELTLTGTPFEAGQIVVGGWQGTSGKFTGGMDDFRLTIGTALYTGDFTPPGEHPTS